MLVLRWTLLLIPWLKLTVYIYVLVLVQCIVIALSYKSSTVSRPSCILFALVRATSNSFHVAVGTNFNHLSSTSSKHFTTSFGLFFSILLSTEGSIFNSKPTSLHKVACFLITYLLRSLAIGVSSSIGTTVN